MFIKLYLWLQNPVQTQICKTRFFVSFKHDVAKVAH